MCHEEDCCFQCQESGHIASHCPNVSCFECDKYGHIVVDCLHWIPALGTPAHHHRQKSHTRHSTRLTYHHQDKYRCSSSRPIHIDTTATVTMIPTETTPGHIMDTIDIIIAILHDALTPVLIIPAVTPHIADCLHTRAHQLTLGTTASHDPIQHTNQVRKPCINHQHIPAELKTNHMIKEIQES